MPLTASELETFAKSTGKLMREMLSPMIARLDALEDRLDALPTVKDGRDGLNGKDGRDADSAAVHSAVADFMESYPIQMPKDGRDGRDGKDGKDGRDGKDGKDSPVRLDDEALEEHVESWLKAHPPSAGKDGINGVNGKDGAPGKDADIEDLMPIVEGLMSKAVADIERRARDWVDKAIESLPKPKDGKDGRDGVDGEDGRDGFSLNDFDIAMNGDGRTAVLSFTNGTTKIERTIKLMGIKYREIWQGATSYEVGDCVTYDGSMWIALKENIDSKPGEYNRVWRLAVKRGRNGKSVE